jgi:hypothetical protein
MNLLQLAHDDSFDIHKTRYTPVLKRGLCISIFELWIMLTYQHAPLITSAVIIW